jgi:hypothetical protein
MANTIGLKIKHSLSFDALEHAPLNPMAGDIYLSTDGNLYQYNNSAWSKIPTETFLLKSNENKSIESGVRYTYTTPQTFSNAGDLVTKKYVDDSVGGATVNQDVFTITSPQVNFTLIQITPVTTILKCFHVQNGQVYTCGTGGLTVSGQVVSFPANSFDYVTAGTPATLIFEQIVFATINRTTH